MATTSRTLTPIDAGAPQKATRTRMEPRPSPPVTMAMAFLLLAGTGTHGFSPSSVGGNVPPSKSSMQRRQPSTGPINGDVPYPATVVASSLDAPLKATPFNQNPAAMNNGVSSFTSSVSSTLDSLYDSSGSIKCPFFRRRAADLIDGAAMVMRFLLIRHKSLIPEQLLENNQLEEAEMLAFSAPGCKPLGRHIKRHPDGTARKARNLPVGDVADRIRGDWAGGASSDKGYYITGKLDSTIYRDDCLFTGPDPDMPVRGLRKYLSAAAHLFDQRESHAELLSMQTHELGGERGHGMIEVTWRLGGVIQLPWHPTVEPWTGTTRYHLDEEGLVYLHEEKWDISVWRAFICTLYPEAETWRIWELEKVSFHMFM